MHQTLSKLKYFMKFSAVQCNHSVPPQRAIRNSEEGLRKGGGKAVFYSRFLLPWQCHF